AERQVFSDGTREVGAYVIDKPHSMGLMVGYVSDARIAYVTDIWSPGPAPLPEKLTPPLAALVAGVKKACITPTKFAGGHGSVADYAPLAALEGKERRYSGPLANQSRGSAARTRASGRPSSRRTMLVPSTSATHL
ncbi:MAG: hypothetical protein ACRELZ_00540, partial [Candidatus Rokuibacteriota bacterium]